MNELVICQPALGEVEDANVVVERASESLNERGLAGPRRAMEKVTATVGDSYGASPKLLEDGI